VWAAWEGGGRMVEATGQALLGPLGLWKTVEGSGRLASAHKWQQIADIDTPSLLLSAALWMNPVMHDARKLRG